LGADNRITPWLSGGLSIFRNGFTLQRAESPDKKAENGGIGSYALFHLVRRPTHTWYASAGGGFSGFILKKFWGNGKASANGYYYQFGAGVRRYFGRHFGFFIETNYTNHQYKTLTIESGINKGREFPDLKLRVRSLFLQAGLVYALGK